ncbi:antiviral RADAR system adenosine triphosphatase RdrA [Pseudomonas asiatica]|uniref:antiviral RADAR system adenosine triphosphatase RdrA n=1 Tax=Pseudomonas asiatica TaxID=2219225 RepID=UPI00383A7C98
MFNARSADSSIIRLPIEQKEQAVQKEASTLLAREIYHDLATLLADSLNNQPENDDDVDLHRSHSAILIDGKRGAGKSSVLVNLKLYLECEQPELENQVHILKPVDPTLLEDTDDLFLNVIVAAIIRDKTIARALSCADHKAEAFHHQLQVLGNTLENLQSQREKYGLDKLRAFMGSHDLMQQVHILFKKALDLIGKKLLVLPIDDVDTSMNRAFENLEVVRRYLTSPYAQPIISGDLSLYHEVTWRDFHARITDDSDIKADDVIQKAKDLATEYQRKVMPLQLRREMPSAGSYLKRKDIVLCNGAKDYFSLRTFWRWMDALLNERINSSEGRRLKISVETVRELAQLIFAMRHEIPKLHAVLAGLQANILDDYALHRLMFMPASAMQRMAQFSEDYQKAQNMTGKSQRETARNRAYADFFNQLQDVDGADLQQWQKLILESKSVLLRHMRHELSESAMYLSLMADQHFALLMKTPAVKLSDLFETPLFKPQNLSFETIKTFPETHHQFIGDELFNRAPSTWVYSLPFNNEFPYTYPEAGYATKTNNSIALNEQTQLLIDLMLHRSFYNESKKANLIYCGRLFELVIASLVRDLEPRDITSIIARAPFYSLPAISGMVSSDLNTPPDEGAVDTVYDSAIANLTQQINEWRRTERIDQQLLSGWLVFNVLNRYFSQAWLFNQPLKVNQNPAKESLHHLADVARRAYRSLWGAFASLEKGEVFGMPYIIADVNVGEGENFENSGLYLQNISPFMHRSGNRSFGREVRSYTHALATHPLRKLVEATYQSAGMALEIDDELIELVNVDENKSRHLTNIIKKHFGIKGPIKDALEKLEVRNLDINNIVELAKAYHIGEEIFLSNPHFNYLITHVSTEDN